MSQFSFRPLDDDDLPMMHRWLNEPGVIRWWEGSDSSWEAVVEEYGSLDPEEEDDGNEHWIAMLDGEPIGWIQCRAIEDFEEGEADPWLAAGAVPTGAGIDYLLGEAGTRGKGVGSGMVEAFVEQIVFGMHPTWTQVAADPYDANVASWRCLEKAGFRLLGMVPNTGDADGPSRLMGLDRPPGI